MTLLGSRFNGVWAQEMCYCGCEQQLELFSLKDIVFSENRVISSCIEINRSTRLACFIFPAPCSPTLVVEADPALLFVLPYVNRKGQRWCHAFDVAQHTTQWGKAIVFWNTHQQTSLSNDGARSGKNFKVWAPIKNLTGNVESASATYCCRSSVGYSFWCWNEPHSTVRHSHMAHICSIWL